ncbi:FtsK/SpoIIIE family protein [Streptococcus infantarius subsp. infantarius]|uniref:FtsK/SpoIIIE domain-containing protein n=1 Tax=uncultured Streptococcus sp. TaxID=83427 RepID=UPI00208F31E7|nr:FtsK/SpoIIIE domain-containing protein [uncultured Streptococcus sp.]MCO4640680.1 FtsK/SpoIIIE family protein [Streptococcus infantarius subsp. infantarius]MCO4662301.1 FtsK/SpoIIIE family protein [Streptococcus infantarius subsp. infantarius]MCO4677155.1 FtsK/SpoIIIE family protein [Streptococcus infantarius subsp. infantarius]
MRLLPEYRGRRVRPYMRKLNMILAFIFSFVLLLPAVAFGYVNVEALKAVDVKTIVILAVLSVLAVVLGIWFAWLFREQTPLGKKIDRLGIMSRYLFEHGFVYEKKKKGQNPRTSYRYPKVYMRQRKFDLDVSFEMAGNKFQDKFTKMGSELEKTLFMDFMETLDDVKYKTYTMAYQAFLNRIDIPNVAFEQGKGLLLMKNFYWDFDSDPHLLVAGGTGGGKTVLLRTLILALAKIGVVDICDPKQADFITMADMKAFQGRVAFSVDDIVEQFEKAFVIMMARYKFMNDERKRLNHKDLKKYYDYGLEPYFLVCDEYNALMSMLDYKQRERVDSAIGNLLLLGRQAGCFVVIAMQKPSREDLGSKLQANINMRLSVGRLDEAGYDIMFGEVNRNKEFKYLKYISGRRVYGRGYGAIMGDVAREFYSPNLTKGFEFYDYFEQLERHDNRFDPTENTEVSADIVNDKELLAVATEATNQANQMSVNKEKTEETKYSLKEVADSIGASRPQVFKILKMVEDEGYTTFERDDNDQKVLSSSEVAMVKELFDFKATNDLTWSNAVEQYFTKED